VSTEINTVVKVHSANGGGWAGACTHTYTTFSQSIYRHKINGDF